MQISSEADIAQTLEAFIRKRFQVSPADRYFTWDTRLWDEGYIDSLGTVELISFLKDAFQFSMPLDEILFHPDFVNIRGIARVVFEYRRRGMETAA
jgi:acyl carrier protein